MDWAVKRYPMYYGGVKQVYPNVEPGNPIFSRSVKVGNLILLSGAAGRTLETGDVPSDDFVEQMLVCLDKIKLALEEAGSSLENLVKTLVLLRDAESCSLMWRTMLDYYRKNAPRLAEEPPACTVIQVASLAKSHYRVEIDAVAAVSGKKRGWELKRYPLYSGGVRQAYPHIKPGMPFMSESVAVGNLLFLSGVTGDIPAAGNVPPDIVGGQVQAVHRRVRAAMENAGSSTANIIKTFHLLTSMEAPASGAKDGRVGYSPATARMWKAELEYYEREAPFLLDEPPASTFMQVGLPGYPRSLAGIDVVGIVSRERRGCEVENYPLYYGQRGLPRHLGDTRMYYSSAVRVGKLLFLSGMTGVSPYSGRIETDVFEEQMVTALDRVRAALEEAGSSLNNLVKTVMLLRDLEDYPRMRKAELEYYRKHAPLLLEEPPASTFILPRSLATPRFLVEVDAVGVVP